jgi:hypothetical protein
MLDKVRDTSRLGCISSSWDIIYYVADVHRILPSAWRLEPLIKIARFATNISIEPYCASQTPQDMNRLVNSLTVLSFLLIDSKGTDHWHSRITVLLVSILYALLRHV